MIEIDRISLVLPGRLSDRSGSIVQATARALAARGDDSKDARIRALRGIEVQAKPDWSDAELGGAIAEAVWSAAQGGESGPW